MNLLNAAEAALHADPAAFVSYKLANDTHYGRKCEYLAVYSGEGRELLQIDHVTKEHLARSGIIEAGPFDQETGTYCFRQVLTIAR